MGAATSPALAPPASYGSAAIVTVYKDVTYYKDSAEYH